MRARSGQRGHSKMQRSLATGRGNRAHALLERSHSLFKDGDGRVADA